MRLSIAAAYSYEATLEDTPSDLRARLTALTGQSFRRINRFTELALLGALQCSPDGVGADTALYLASEAPMLSDCVRALRGVITEQRPPTPFEFMNISGNMAGFYIAQHLRMDGPQLAVHRSGGSLQAALELLSLSSAGHRRALLGYVEEGVWPLPEQRLRLGLPSDRALAECSHWLYLDADCPQPLAVIEGVDRLPDRAALQALEARLGAGWELSAGADAALRSALDLAPAPAALAYSSGRAAAALARFARDPGAAPGLLYVEPAGDGYLAIRVRRGAQPA